MKVLCQVQNVSRCVLHQKFVYKTLINMDHVTSTAVEYQHETGITGSHYPWYTRNIWMLHITYVPYPFSIWQPSDWKHSFAFLPDSDTEPTDVIYHSKIWRHNFSEVLKKLCGLEAEMNLDMKDINLMFPQLKDDDWINALLFLIDVSEHIRERFIMETSSLQMNRETKDFTTKLYFSS
jgi:hypothetical protein